MAGLGCGLIAGSVSELLGWSRRAAEMQSDLWSRTQTSGLVAQAHCLLRAALHLNNGFFYCLWQIFLHLSNLYYRRVEM